MAVSNWSTTAASNNAVGSIDISEGCAAGNLNDAIREVMAEARSKFDSHDTSIGALQSDLVEGFRSYTTYAALAAAFQPYNAATAYAVNNTVLNQNAFWLNVSASTGVAPPTLPTTSNANWTLISSAPAGLLAIVPITDTGTHTDPVVGGTVNNTGIFSYSLSPAGWQRLYDVSAAAAQTYSNAASTSATNAATSASQAATSATNAANSATSAAASATSGPLALDKAGGNRTFATAALGSYIANGTSGSLTGAVNYVWLNPNSAATILSHITQLTIPIAVAGDGTLTVVIASVSGTQRTIQQVIPLTGLTVGTNTPNVTADMQPGWVIGWWTKTGGAQVNGQNTSSVNYFSTSTTPTLNQVFTVGTSTGQQYPIQASVNYEPNGNQPRIAGLEGDFTSKVTFGDTNGGASNSGVATYTPNNTVAELAYFDTLAVVVDAPGTGLIEVLVPDANGNYTLSASYPITIPNAGLNTLQVGSAAMLTACPYLPTVFPVAPGTRIAFRALTLNLKFQAGTGASVVTGDTALGASVTITASQDAAVAVTFRTRRTDQAIPAARDEILQATATVSGSNVTVFGVLNRKGSPVQFGPTTLTLAAVGTGSVTGEAQTINTSVLTGILAHANVSNVVVTRVSDGLVLTEGTHYTVNYENGVIQATVALGTTAVTVNYNYSNRRYDAIYLNPETLAVGIVAGTERVRDACEYIPAVPTTAPATMRLFNVRLTSTTQDVVPTWEFFVGERRELQAQLNRERRRARSLFRKFIGKLRRGEAVNVGGPGDSIMALQPSGSTNPTSGSYNGPTRDRFADYLGGGAYGIATDTIAPIAATKYDFGDGAGAVHSKAGWTWTLLQELCDAYGYTVNVPQNAGQISTANNVINWFNFAIAGTSSGAAPNMSAITLDLCLIHYGMNELPINSTQQNATETQVGSIITTQLATGAAVMVVGVERPNQSYYTASAPEWPLVNRALRRAAEAKGAVFVSPHAIYDDTNLGAIGLAAKDTCMMNFYVHPGIAEHAAMGRLYASPLLDE